MIELLRARRSVRKYTPRAVDPAVIDRVLEAMLSAPSSRGRRPWQLIVVDDPRLLDDLSRPKPHGASFLAHAPIGIVVCDDEQVSGIPPHLRVHSIVAMGHPAADEPARSAREPDRSKIHRNGYR